MRSLILLTLSLVTCAVAKAAALSASDSDVCALRPDLCDAAPARTVRKVARRAKPRNLDAQSMSLASVVPSRKLASTPTRSITCRPAHVEITERNENLPECGKRGPAGQAAGQPNFNAYLVQNSRNPALSNQISDYQTAFKDLTPTATLDLSGMMDNASASRGSGTQAGSSAVQPRANQ